MLRLHPSGHFTSTASLSALRPTPKLSICPTAPAIFSARSKEIPSSGMDRSTKSKSLIARSTQAKSLRFIKRAARASANRRRLLARHLLRHPRLLLLLLLLLLPLQHLLLLPLQHLLLLLHRVRVA